MDRTPRTRTPRASASPYTKTPSRTPRRDHTPSPSPSSGLRGILSYIASPFKRAATPVKQEEEDEEQALGLGAETGMDAEDDVRDGGEDQNEPEGLLDWRDEHEQQQRDASPADALAERGRTLQAAATQAATPPRAFPSTSRTSPKHTNELLAAFFREKGSRPLTPEEAVECFRLIGSSVGGDAAHPSPALPSVALFSPGSSHPPSPTRSTISGTTSLRSSTSLPSFLSPQRGPTPGAHRTPQHRKRPIYLGAGFGGSTPVRRRTAAQLQLGAQGIPPGKEEPDAKGKRRRVQDGEVQAQAQETPQGLKASVSAPAIAPPTPPAQASTSRIAVPAPAPAPASSPSKSTTSLAPPQRLGLRAPTASVVRPSPLRQVTSLDSPSPPRPAIGGPSAAPGTPTAAARLTSRAADAVLSILAEDDAKAAADAQAREQSIINPYQTADNPAALLPRPTRTPRKSRASTSTPRERAQEKRAKQEKEEEGRKMSALEMIERTAPPKEAAPKRARTAAPAEPAPAPKAKPALTPAPTPGPAPKPGLKKKKKVEVVLSDSDDDIEVIEKASPAVAAPSAPRAAAAVAAPSVKTFEFALPKPAPAEMGKEKEKGEEEKMEVEVEKKEEPAAPKPIFSFGAAATTPTTATITTNAAPPKSLFTFGSAPSAPAVSAPSPFPAAPTSPRARALGLPLSSLPQHTFTSFLAITSPAPSAPTASSARALPASALPSFTFASLFAKPTSLGAPASLDAPGFFGAFAKATQKPAGQKSCSTCMCSSPAEATKCAVCEEPFAPVATPAAPAPAPAAARTPAPANGGGFFGAASAFGIKPKPVRQKMCGLCSCTSPADATQCVVCEAPL